MNSLNDKEKKSVITKIVICVVVLLIIMLIGLLI